MALTLDQLLASFPDNNQKQITALNMRDFVESVELKYDNWTVVKPGQPNGNKFPDPVGGEIILPDNTVWVINGGITIFDTLVFGQNTQIISLSGTFSLNGIAFDATVTGKPLIRCVNNYAFTVRGIALQLTDGTQTMFDIQQGSIVVFEQVLFAFQQGAGGTINDCFSALFTRCFSLSSLGGTPVQVTGSFVTFVIDSHQTANGFVGTSVTLFDMTGVTGIDYLRVENCSIVLDAQPIPLIAANDSTVLSGLIQNNRLFPGSIGSFISGITNLSVNTTFLNNSGNIPNTKVFGALVMAKNTNTTTNPGLNLWAAVVGNNQDTLASGTTRFNRPNPLELRYIGKETFRGQLVCSISVRRAAGTAATKFSVGIFKNGALINQPYAMSLVSITRVGTLATATMSASFPLVNGQIVTVSGANEPQYNGTFVISGVTPTTFQYTMASDPGSSATGTLVAQLPVEVVMPLTVTDVTNNATIAIPVELAQNDVVKPFIRGDGSGTVNTVIEDCAINIQ